MTPEQRAAKAFPCEWYLPPEEPCPHERKYRCANCTERRPAVAQAIREAVEADRGRCCEVCGAECELLDDESGLFCKLCDRAERAEVERDQLRAQLAEAKAEVIGCEAQLRGFELALGGGVLGDTLTIMEGWPFARAMHEAVRLYAQLTCYKRVVEAARNIGLETVCIVNPPCGDCRACEFRAALAECREEPTP